jgi:hypothetical protein
MTEDHEQIEELLAGYALHTLTGSDAAEADRLLGEHVPTCSRCRETLADFQLVSGDLALAAGSDRPPDVLLPRLRHSFAPAAAPAGRRRPIPIWASVGVAVASLLGLFAWNTVLNQRLNHTTGVQSRLADAMGLVASPKSSKIPLQTQQQPAAAHMLAVYDPDAQQLLVLGGNIPDPAPGHVYRLWLGRGGTFLRSLAFLPEDGIVVLGLYVNLGGYDAMMITEENAGPPGPSPRGVRRWFTTF